MKSDPLDNYLVFKHSTGMLGFCLVCLCFLMCLTRHWAPKKGWSRSRRINYIRQVPFLLLLQDVLADGSTNVGSQSGVMNLDHIPSRKWTYPHLGKRKIIFKYALSGGYVNFPGGYRMKTTVAASDQHGPPKKASIFCLFGLALCLSE